MIMSANVLLLCLLQSNALESQADVFTLLLLSARHSRNPKDIHFTTISNIIFQKLEANICHVKSLKREQ